MGTKSTEARLGRLEAQQEALDAAAVVITPPGPSGPIGELLLELLRTKLEASRALAAGAAALMQSPAWVARQTPADLQALGTYLDSSAISLGDRLAAQSTREEQDRG